MLAAGIEETACLSSYIISYVYVYVVRAMVVQKYMTLLNSEECALSEEKKNNNNISEPEIIMSGQSSSISGSETTVLCDIDFL